MQTTRGASLSDPGESTRPGPPAPVGSRRRLALLGTVAVVVLAADIISKIEIVRHLQPGQQVTVVDHALWLTLTRNPGAAFSIGTGQTALFALVAVGVVIAILRTARRLRNLGWAITLGLLLGGALGNLVDRVFRAPGPFRGYVVDWIKLPHWPVFNLADSAIVVGGCLAVLLALSGVDVDTRRGSGPAGDPGSSEAGRAGDPASSEDGSAFSQRE
jgi:signal peptidase II